MNMPRDAILADLDPPYVEIFSGDNLSELTEWVNNRLKDVDLPVIDIKMSTNSAGPSEDQWTVTTVMILWKQKT